MLSDLMVGAQYCSSTHCEYQELQLEPSAFHAVRTYACTDAETGETGEAGSDVAAPSTPPRELAAGLAPPPLTALFGLKMFGLTAEGMTALHSGPRAPEPQMEAGGGEGDDALAELDPGDDEGEASDMLVPPQAVEMA